MFYQHLNTDNINLYILNLLACFIDSSLGDSTILSAHQQAVTQPLVLGLDSLPQEVSAHGKEVLENVLDDCLQQMSNLQLNKVKKIFQS